jgi:hypothetical protein
MTQDKVSGWHFPVFGGLGSTLCGIKFAPENITVQKSKLTCDKCKQLVETVEGHPYAPKRKKL